MLSKNNSVSSLLNLAVCPSSMDRAIHFGADKMLSVDEFCKSRPEGRLAEKEGSEGTDDNKGEPITNIEHEDAEYLVDVLGLQGLGQGQ